MELTAVIRCLQELGPDVHIVSDSQYVVKGITQWIHNWKKKNYKKVKNVDLWKELDSLNSPDTKWEWVRGHDGNEYNEIADGLAVAGIPK